jgi:hypothetical protein
MFHGCTITNKQNVEPWKLSTSWGHTKVSFFNDVKICVASYFMYGVSHEGKYCTKFLNQYSFICSKVYKLYKYNINMIRKMKIKDANLFNTVGCCIYTVAKSIIYLLFSYQTGYIMWHSRLRIYNPWGAYICNMELSSPLIQSKSLDPCMGCLMKENTVLNF